MNKIISFVTFILCFTNIQSQNYGDKTFYLTDSLDLETLSEYDRQLVDTSLSQYHNAGEDSLKIFHIKKIVNESGSIDVMKIYNQFVKTQIYLFLDNESRLYKEYLAEYYGDMGYIYNVNNNIDSAILNYKKSLELSKQINNNSNIGRSLLQIGKIYENKNFLKKAVDTYKKAIPFLEKDSSINLLATAYDYISNVLKAEEKNEDALFFLIKSISYSKISKVKDYSTLGYSYASKSRLLQSLKKYNEAILSCDSSILNFNKINDLDGVAYTYTIFTSTYLKKNDFVKAKYYISKALETASKNKKSVLYSVVVYQNAQYYFEVNDIINAEKYGLIALEKFKELNFESYLIKEYGFLEKLYFKKQNHKKAYLYNKNKQELIDKKNTEKEDAILKYKIEYDFKQEKKHSEFVHQKEIELAEAEKQKSFNAMLFLGMIAILIALFSVYTYNKLKIIRTQKEALDNAYLKLEESKKNELAVSNLKALKSQMNPHFIFNLLNSIQYMVLQGDIDNSYNFINKFAGLVRNTLDYSDREKIRLSEEIKLLEVYMKLEKLRFQDDLEYEFIKTNIREVELPPMLIQPFIENALIHGLLHKKGLRKLKITFKIGKTVECTVEDNGIGRKKAKEIKDRQKSSHKSFSTNAIEKRFSILQDTYKENIGYTYYDLEPNESSDISTKVVIKIPYDEIKINDKPS